MFTIITGSQFGDEGKGKIVDLMAKDYDLIVRFQGGDNAGHTVVVNGKKYKLHHTPSGVLLDARLLIGPGTVLNPRTLAREFDMLSDNGIMVNEHKLGIDAKTSIIMPYHVELDGLRESARSEKIGTTRRVIAYAYMDKIARDEIQLSDLAHEAQLRRRLKEMKPIKAAQITNLGGDGSIMKFLARKMPPTINTKRDRAITFSLFSLNQLSGGGGGLFTGRCLGSLLVLPSVKLLF